MTTSATHCAIDADWRIESARIIAALYDTLGQLAPSPVVELNRAVARSMAFGPEAGLELVNLLMSEPSLRNYRDVFFASNVP